jgi:hypothetical protein
MFTSLIATLLLVNGNLPAENNWKEYSFGSATCSANCTCDTGAGTAGNLMKATGGDEAEAKAKLVKYCDYIASSSGVSCTLKSLKCS